MMCSLENMGMGHLGKIKALGKRFVCGGVIVHTHACVCKYEL